MFLDLKKALKIARECHCAIGAFNVFDLEGAKAVASAAQRLNAPVIFQTTPTAIDYAGLPQLFNIIKNEIHEKNIKAAIHLDHAKDFSLVKRCIDIGYNSVMIDGSELDFDSNIHLTRKVVNFASNYEVNVEAEFGSIGKEGGGDRKRAQKQTDPDLVAKFVSRTGLSALGVSVGNAHGAPRGEKINVTLLENISRKTDIPLVMHGSSGLGEDDIEQAKKLGVAKFNIDTNLRKAFIEEVEKYKSKGDPRELLEKIMSAQEAVVAKYIKVFNSDEIYEKV